MGIISEKKQLTKKSKNISEWYLDVIAQAELADYGPAKGTMIIRPYGYAIWENVQKALDDEIKKSGVLNAYFPLFIPNSLFVKEKEHVEGFAPETAVVTIGGGEKLADPLIVRPTSEMVMYEAYSRWISSWRDLPMVINQWNNVVRWEKRTYPFLRTSEFLWQEGHGAYATKEENWERVLWGINTYAKTYRDLFAIEGYVGKKSESEKFAGAQTTLTYEMLMPDGKVLQGCTSHDLGQNFSKTLGIQFQNKDGKNDFVWQDSWGLSTRCLGALVLVHGDDNGLVLPPKLAPVKVVIIPILGKKDEKILKYCQKIKEVLERGSSNFPGKVEIYGDDGKSFGWRINEAEIKGIPVRVEVGSRELEEKTATLSFRLPEKDKKLTRFSDISEKVEEALKQIQEEMLEKCQKFLSENTRVAEDYKEFKNIIKNKRGFVKTFWCEDPDCEAKIKEETKATTRLKPLDAKKEEGKCIYCGKKAEYIWYFAQSY
jgi:prolyl-tRNA synthetase